MFGKVTDETEEQGYVKWSVQKNKIVSQTIGGGQVRRLA